MKLHKTNHTQFLIALLCLLITGFTSATAQKLELTLSPGYAFSGNINSILGNVDVKNDFDYSMALGYRIPNRNMLELSYTLMNSEATLTRIGRENDPKTIDLKAEYFMFSFIKDPTPEYAMVRPFFGLSIGAVMVSPQGDEYESFMRFATGSTVGIKVFPTTRVGLRFSGRLLLPVMIDSAAFLCNGYDCDPGVNAKTFFIQTDLQLGLVIRLY